MTHSAKSVLVGGIYVFLLGLVLTVAPNALLGLLGVPSAKEVWIRVVGVIAGILGFYYIQAARHGLTPFFRTSVYGRTAVLIASIVFALLRLVEPILTIFGVICFIGAVWTALALRAESV
jgi:hypothetical protein